MALTDKNGAAVKVSDKVRTPFGDVVQIQGRLPKRREIAMSDCELVDRSTPVSDSGEPATGEVLFA
jgi:hypothetical protein